VSFQIRGGMNRGTAFLFEILGEKGDLQLTATARASMQRQELNVRGARSDEWELTELPIPGKLSSLSNAPLGEPIVPISGTAGSKH